MPINLPQGLGNAYTEVLDSSPILNFNLQQKARKAAMENAKNEAFDEYIRGLNTKITPTGVRAVDMDAFNDRKSRWVQHTMENKDKLRSMDVQTQMENNRLYQETLNIPIESKSAEEQKKPMVEILTDPNKRSRLSTAVLPVIASHDESLYKKDEATGEYVRNDKRTPIDYNSNIFDPKMDFAKSFEGWFKGMDRGEIVGKDAISRDSETGTVKFPTEKKFTPEQIKQGAINTINDVLADSEKKNFYQYKWEKVDHDSPEFTELNKHLKSVFGSDAVIDSAEELAAAEAIAQAKAMTEKGTKDLFNRELANQRAVNRIFINNSGGGGGVSGNEFDRIGYEISLPMIEGKVYNKEKTEPYTGSWAIFGKNIPRQTIAILKTGGIEVDPNKQYYLDIRNGVTEQITTVPDKNGAVQKIADRIDMENAQKKANSEPQKASQPYYGGRDNPVPTKEKKTEPKPITPTYRSADLIKAGWTQDQINKAVKAGKIKVN